MDLRAQWRRPKASRSWSDCGELTFFAGDYMSLELQAANAFITNLSESSEVDFVGRFAGEREPRHPASEL